MESIYLLTFNVTTKFGKTLFTCAHACKTEKACNRIKILCEDFYKEQGRRITNVQILKRQIWDE